MDLHDFADVAMNYDNYLKAFGGSYDGFEEFYISLAEKYGGDGIIDIACGTGALTLPLAERGLDITACDLSEAMVNITNQKFKSAGLSTQTFSANMVDFKAARKFSLAIIARSGFMHLLTTKEQRAALINIKNHLTDSGILTLNIFIKHNTQPAYYTSLHIHHLKKSTRHASQILLPYHVQLA
jgi:2-polyprenyl-3-methyl-5-hydroxy-6-metoxy-1,4-benzoquinol methylase